MCRYACVHGSVFSKSFIFDIIYLKFLITRSEVLLLQWVIIFRAFTYRCLRACSGRVTINIRKDILFFVYNEPRQNFLFETSPAGLLKTYLPLAFEWLYEPVQQETNRNCYRPLQGYRKNQICGMTLKFDAIKTIKLGPSYLCEDHEERRGV